MNRSFQPGPAYFDALAELRTNPAQWQIFESRGNSVVLAGPGSGKTRVLTVKLARVLAEDVRPPGSVACITFSAECARELRRRLSALGVDEGNALFVGTVHSFCLTQIVLPFAEVGGIELARPVTVASRAEQQHALTEAARSVFGRAAGPGLEIRLQRYRRVVLDLDHHEQVDPEGAALLEGYERALHAAGRIDFDDMVLSALRLVETHAWVRSTLVATFPVLAIDEYQDLGAGLHRIVLALIDAGTRVVAVGDPDQSIYGFVGARPQLLLSLAERCGVEPVRLPFNYRSGRTIIEASEAVLGEHRGYESRSAEPGTVDEYECLDGLGDQAERICDEIVPAALGRDPSRRLGDVAVLYPDRYHGDVIASAATERGIAFQRIDAGAPYPKSPLMRWLEDCAAWCAGGWRSAEPKMESLLRNLRALVSTCQKADKLDEWKLRLVQFLADHREPDLGLTRWLVLLEEALLCEFLSDGTLTDESEAFRILKAAADQGGALDQASVAVFGGQGGSPHHLNLITLHSAKGLEFDVVIMMGMDEGTIPSYRDQDDDALREARRKFYVGFTRASREVHLTYSGFRQDGYGRRYVDGPSRFVLEARARLQAGQ